MPEYRQDISRRARVLHLSADIPDLINQAKTPVITRLIDLVDDRYDNCIMSFNRRQPTMSEVIGLAIGRMSPTFESTVREFDRGVCLEYRAPSKGLFHASMLDRLSQWIAARIARQAIKPDLIVGHKLTVEGILARAVALRLGIPYAITIQGNTDQKIISARPDLARRFGAVFHGAACVFSFAPWARTFVEQRFGQRAAPTLDLPCPTLGDIVRPPVCGGSALVSVFHLRNHKVKNLEGIAAAMRALEASGHRHPVQVFGGGSPSDMSECEAIARKTHGLKLMGPRSIDEVGPIMNNAIALLMPSKRETFGLVFLEALFAGIPIIYPKGAGVDGYFDGLPFAIAVNARDTQAIGDAIRHVVLHEVEIKSALAKWQQSGALDRFSRPAIGAAFANGLNRALASSERLARTASAMSPNVPAF